MLLRDTLCTIPNCNKPYRAKGLCHMHYMRKDRHGDTDSMWTIGCSVNGCLEPHRSKGYCGKHYTRWVKSGDPLVVKRKHGEGKNFATRFWSRVAVTANPDKCWKWQGATYRNGYGTLTHNHIQTGAHRVAWQITHGVVPTEQILHKCDNPICVNPNHLWEGTQQDNITDMIKKGRGQKFTHSSLNIEQVQRIRILLAQGFSRKQITEIEGVPYRSVSNIDTDRCFTWIR